MTTDIDKKREYLTSLYPGYSWHDKVAHMPNEQVVAVYLRFQRDGFPRTEPKLNPDLKLEDPAPVPRNDDQPRLFDVIEGQVRPVPRPPHENEDDFPI